MEDDTSKNNLFDTIFTTAEEDNFFSLISPKIISEAKEIWECPHCFNVLENFFNSCTCGH